MKSRLSLKSKYLSIACLLCFATFCLNKFALPVIVAQDIGNKILF